MSIKDEDVGKIELEEPELEKKDIEEEPKKTESDNNKRPIIIGIPRERDYIRIFDDVTQYVHINISQGGEETTNPKSVISGHFRINKKYDIDGFTYFDVSVEKRQKIMSMESIIKLLKTEGKVLKSGLLNDTVQTIASQIKNVGTGYSAIGIYENNEKLELCLNPIPISDEQDMIWSKIKDKEIIDYKVKKEDIEAYIQYINYYHPYETYPIMGLSVMAPYNLIIKEYHILVPILYILGKRRSIGKSKTVSVFTEKLFSMDMTSAERLNSEFRFNEIMNSACLPQGFDEGERIDFDKMITIRESCENKMISSRGRPDLTQIRYFARLSPFFTGNDLNAKKPETLKRLFVIHFDGERWKNEDYINNSKKIDELVNTLNPIGYEIMKQSITMFETKSKLYNAIKVCKELLQQEMQFEDVTKPWGWGVCYLGLKVWEKVCKKYDVDWKLPTIKEFVNDVVKKVEGSTWEGKEESAIAFRDWFDGWLQRHTRMEQDPAGGLGIKRILGEGEIIKYYVIEDNNEKRVSGYWITNTILQEYNKDIKSMNLPPISNLKRLAESISQEFNIELEKIAEIRDGKSSGKSTNIGGITKIATFIPIGEGY